MSHRPTDSFLNTLSWLSAATLAAFMALNTLPWSHTSDGYVPAGNDSFYHARRILDTVDERTGFYEFDNRIHVPEGSWVVWPWAYDYTLALTTSATMAVTGINEPMTILAYLPLVFTFLNTALLMMVAGALGLSLRWRLLAGIAFALSAVNQSLHGIGILDHHWVELSFILTSVWSAMRWAEQPDRTAYAGATGFVLGIAPAFHVALFALQIPVLLGMVRLWSKSEGPTGRTSLVFSVSLICGLLAMLFGSRAFYEGLWSYYLFSWFHLYIGVCSSVAVIAMASIRCSLRSALVLAFFALATLFPLISEIAGIGGFFGKAVPGLSGIVETQSLVTLLSQNHQYWLRDYFTYLLIFTPLTLIGCIIAYWRNPSPRELIFAAFGLLSLPLFFLQVRFQYFGIAFLILGPLWGAHKVILARPGARNSVIFAVFGLYATALLASVLQRANTGFELGRDPHYAWVHPLMPELADTCKHSPGIVFAAPNEGHFVRFHSDCSVIANNFLLTPQHARKYLEAQKMLQWTPKELRTRRPDVRYVLATHRIFKQYHPSGLVTLAGADELARVNADTPLMTDLLLSSENKFDGFEVIDEVVVEFHDGEAVPYARLFRVVSSPESKRSHNAPTLDTPSSISIQER